MRILVLPSWYPTKENPVYGAFFAEQAEALSRYGHDVSVLAVRGDAHGKSFVEEGRRGGVREFILHVEPVRFHLTFFRTAAMIRRLFSEKFRGSLPEIVHVHSFGAIPYARYIKLRWGIPFVVTEHVSWFERGLLTKKDLRRIRSDYAAASAVIAVSGGLRDQIAPLCRGEVLVVPNLVGERFFEGEPAARDRKDGEFRYISVGSLDKNKGMDAVLEAFAGASAARAELRLTICGDGPERDALRLQAEKLGIADRTVFTGRVDPNEVPGLLRESDAFVLASRVETFGIVLAEAMACGLPIIMTKTSAWRELADDSTGIAVDVDDIPALSEAMERMASEDRYDPERIRAYCRARFSGETVCRRLTQIYREVLRR